MSSSSSSSAGLQRKPRSRAARGGQLAGQSGGSTSSEEVQDNEADVDDAMIPEHEEEDDDQVPEDEEADEANEDDADHDPEHEDDEYDDEHEATGNGSDESGIVDGEDDNAEDNAAGNGGNPVYALCMKRTTFGASPGVQQAPYMLLSQIHTTTLHGVPVCDQPNNWMQCSHASHAAPFTVCTVCHFELVTMHPIIMPAAAAIDDLSPLRNWTSALTAQPANGDAFLTRLCFTCEKHETSKERERMGHNGEHHARNTCRCWQQLMNLHPPNLVCYAHLQARWDDQLRRRHAADAWLRSIEPTGTGSGIRTARVATIRRRGISGKWRPCRCGAEVLSDPTNMLAEIFMCLVCEGLIYEANPDDRYRGGLDHITRHRYSRTRAFDRQTRLFRPRTGR